MKKHTIEYLNQLNLEIKSRTPALMDKAFKELSLLNFKGNPDCEVYASYLIGKYYYFLFKKTDLCNFFDKAVESYQNIFALARVYRIKVNNSNYFFKYAEILFELSQQARFLSEQNHLCNKAYLIAIHQGRKYPSNISFNWLQLRILQS